MLTVVDTCRISPPPATVGNRSMPLTFFDIIFLHHFPINQLFFYESPHPISHFMQTIVPNLKHSLSITLQHMFPFASNLILFSNPNHSRKPEIRHVEGDSVQFTLAECDLDFHDLAGYHPRACDKFYQLVPQLGQPVEGSDCLVIPLFAVQVTVFKNSGISIGITNHHVLCDATTKYDFLKAWTSIAQNACAYVWSCIAKSRVVVEKTSGLEEYERFVCLANFRSRIDPPLPETYFGNCVGPCVAITKRALLAGNEGFLIAVESLGEAIKKTVESKDGVLKEAGLWFEMLFKLPEKIPAKIGVAGTPKLKIYDVDFGFGKPKKYETISIDCNGSISVNASKDSPEDLEIGLSLPAKQMDAFIDIFNEGLEKLFT
ncbi:hypothetical protein E3N88_04720 [Mikania micrantha]|uniref:Uncharacterized protein n=1 Tax=Mikania micrantha TaxID=192012 RepID=A0A5N6PVQ5_9ASTR|nr:hypothetical protein E3N88_04720 [Mikania micrantha]